MILTALGLCGPLLATPAAFATHATQTPARPVAIRADKILIGDGREIENATVLFVSGRIAEVGPKVEVPSGVETIHHKGVLTSGMIALHGYAGEHGEVRDDTRPALPDARVGMAFDPDHYDFREAREAGITTLVITPLPQGVTGGTSSVVKSAGRVVMAEEAQLSLCFTSAALANNREPTSYSGALAMLDQLFAKPIGAVERAKSGKLACLFEVSSREDIHRALDFAKRHNLSGSIHGATLAGELVDDIKASKLSVIVPAIEIGSNARSLKAVNALAKSEIPFGFGLDTPFNHPAQMRLGAAMCVQAGLDPKLAWSALTSGAARIAGVADRTGRIDRGLDADVILWSGDPLDLGSKVVAVYVDGARIYGDDR